MYDDDADALAAEYVLGTLSKDERGHAEALLQLDAGFAEIVRQWERRLGELNVMVEAVEPPAQVWDKVKSDIAVLVASEEVRLAPSEPPEPIKATAPAETRTEGNAGTETEGEAPAEGGESPLLAALASHLAAPEDQPEATPQAKSDAEPVAKTDTKPRVPTSMRPSLPQTAPKIEHNTDVFDLARRVRRWRTIALLAVVVAVALVGFVALSQFDPALFPAGRLHMPQLIAQSPPPAAEQSNRLVAVLQQEPTAPAFLLTVDAASRSLTVRRVAAAADSGHAYQLWFIAAGSTGPRPLGLVGTEEFTQVPIPDGLDVDALQTGSYEISFERAGGSTSGAPMGPILFRGKLVEAVPKSLPTALAPSK